MAMVGLVPLRPHESCDLGHINLSVWMCRHCGRGGSGEDASSAG